MAAGDPAQPIVIPLEPSIARYRLTTAIFNVRYLLDVYWNAREQCWYFHLLESDETPIAHGVKIVLGTILARRVHHELTRVGAFIVQDTAAKGDMNRAREAGFDDIGISADGELKRVQLTYWPVYNIISEATK